MDSSIGLFEGIENDGAAARSVGPMSTNYVEPGDCVAQQRPYSSPTAMSAIGPKRLSLCQLDSQQRCSATASMTPSTPRAGAYSSGAALDISCVCHQRQRCLAKPTVGQGIAVKLRGAQRSCKGSSMRVRHGVAVAPDGVSIHYDVRGTGDLTLVFVHGWCCDRQSWRGQVDDLESQFGVVCIDLAGHGESGRDRLHFTIPAFAQDVVAVVKQLAIDRIVLIGHSMSGGVIVEAARHLGTAVIGLVGVDTLWNVDQDRSPEQVAAFVAPFRADFPRAARDFVSRMFTPTFDADLATQITSDVAAFPSAIGAEALESSLGNGANLRRGLDELSLPIVLINSPIWQTTNVEAARRRGIDVTLMAGAGHFLMLEDPPTFNRHLVDAVRRFPIPT